MIIDFHTHIFPDKIAKGAIDSLSKNSPAPPSSDGTYDGLISCLKEAGSDIAINLPILTSPRQFESVTKFAVQLNERFTGEGIYSFGSIHPDSEDIDEKIKLLKSLSVKGIKIHPEYQNCDFDDDRYYNILKAAKENDLICVTHAGYDFAYDWQPMRCTPDKIIRQLKRLGGYPKLVLAHLGGNMLYHEVYEKIAGLDVYLDTAYILHSVSEDNFKAMVAKHGRDKILFATDSPWRNINEEIGIIKGFNLDKITEEMIFSVNAINLIGF